MDRITAEWTQALDSGGAVAIDDASFGTDESNVTLTVDVPFHSTGNVANSFSVGPNGAINDVFNAGTANNLHLFIAQALGYTRYVGPNVNLDRKPPARHPLYPWLRAKKITSVKGMKELRRELSPLGRLRGKPLLTQIYSVYRLTILFESLPYEVLENDEIPENGERNRYVTELVLPRAEILNRPGGQFKFCPPDPPAGIAFPQPIGYTHRTYELIWTWHQVPRQAIFDGMYPKRIADMYAKVNDTTVTNPLYRSQVSPSIGTSYIAGELLLNGAVITPEFAPVAPQLMGLFPFDIPRTYRVEYRIAVDHKGHNKKPDPQNPQNWYVVTSTGVSDGQKIFEAGDFSLLFKPI